jgi:signal transduction histidine kinase
MTSPHLQGKLQSHFAGEAERLGKPLTRAEELHDDARQAEIADAQLDLLLDIGTHNPSASHGASLNQLPLQGVIDALPDGIAIVDRQGRTLLRNEAAVAMLGSYRAGQWEYSVAETDLGVVGLYREIGSIIERDRERDAFLGLVSHEVKSPLTAVRGYIGQALRLLRRGEGELAEAAMQKADANTTKLVALLDDLVDTTRVQLRHCAPQRLELAQFLRESVARLESHVGPRVRLQSPRSLHVLADARLLERVVENLLANAAKYSEPTAPIVIAADRATGEGTVRVRDGGIGIPEAERAHIFEPFYRARNVQGVEGSGLGLYLSRRLIERHGGRLWLEQSDETGSTFAFTLPLAN